MVELLGWVSSLVLLATIVGQIAKQWRARSAQGVSRWLFVGQTVASAGFTAYSALVGNWVFTITNALLLVSALIGCAMTLYFRARDHDGAARARSASSDTRSLYAKRESMP